MQCDYRVVSAPRYLAVFRSLSEKVLRGALCKLRASVVNAFPGNFTTETQSITEFAQRNSFFRQTPKRATDSFGAHVAERATAHDRTALYFFGRRVPGLTPRSLCF